MTDPTVDALHRIKEHAAENCAIVDRVEVRMREVAGETFVEFVAYYSPIPLPQPVACLGYRVADHGK